MDSSQRTPIAAGAKGSDRDRVMDAIDQMFAEFALVYHNQYQKAFPDKEKLMLAKRLWMQHLAHYTPEQILAAVRRVTQESEYLPTVHGVLKYLGANALGLPDARDAYREACLAPSPKVEQRWSHPAVYLAGAASDWFFLASQTEKVALPVYEKYYRALCERVAQGEVLQLPVVPALPERISQPMTAEQRHAAMQALRSNTGL
ncbi:MAG TPA: replication protein P [Pseudomonadales bacterium]|nr:replication protein P [Pseudomonadales bacterium]